MSHLTKLCCLLLFASARNLSAGMPVEFRRDIVPILRAKCFDCHQGQRASSGLRLDLRPEILGETNGRVLVRIGDAAGSALVHAVTHSDPKKRMPKDGSRLSEKEIALLKEWIDQGLAWDEAMFPSKLPGHDHWAFQTVHRPALPKITRQAWVRTPIDAFIAARHESLGLTPNAEADRRTLIRRLYFDLLGLPPSAEAVDAFTRDTSPDAYERLVDRLLASPHYGERWGRHWLDVARWAESEGYESNHPRPYAWRYRDWVVDAFHRDKPFADFVREQLAGDELPYDDTHLIATGFVAAARLSSNEEDRPRQRNDILVDVVNTTASAFLGLTLQCAQCHNHKFDPFTARDYYRLQAYFVQGQPGNLALRDPSLWTPYNARKPAGYDDALHERDALYESARARRVEAARKTLAPAAREALEAAMEKRTPEQIRLAREAELKFEFTQAAIEKGLTKTEKDRYDVVKKRVADMEKSMLDVPQTFGFYSPITSANAIRVLPMKGFYPLRFEPAELQRSRVYLLAQGDVHRPSFTVDAGVPALLGAAGGTRRELADWMSSPKHPLPARVWVNRLWAWHFGRGLVSSLNDFGVKGAKPTHPELLDWLAAEFLASGGSTKRMHRLMACSSTYRQSSAPSAAQHERDPDNHAWWRWDVRRLESEAIRDALLAVSGELDLRVGGASDAANLGVPRRSLYLFQKREAAPQQQMLFDGPNQMTESCAKRLVTTVPLQALYLLNSDFSQGRARALARRIEAAAGQDRAKQIDLAFRLMLQRDPEGHERELALRFFKGRTEDAALVLFCQALFNVNEFAYLE